MLIKQVSIFLENKKGKLCEITGVLKDNNIDLLALTVADTTDFGILRIIVDNPDFTKKVLKDAGYTVTVTNVIGVEIEDRPGGLADITRLLSDNNISIEYIYAFITRTKGSAHVIIKVSEPEKTVALLEKMNIKMLTQSDA